MYICLQSYSNWHSSKDCNFNTSDQYGNVAILSWNDGNQSLAYVELIGLRQS